jgi:hypothetical protein
MYLCRNIQNRYQIPGSYSLEKKNRNQSSKTILKKTTMKRTYIALYTDSKGNILETAEFSAHDIIGAKKYANLYKRRELKERCSTFVRRGR